MFEKGRSSPVRDPQAENACPALISCNLDRTNCPAAKWKISAVLEGRDDSLDIDPVFESMMTPVLPKLSSV